MGYTGFVTNGMGFALELAVIATAVLAASADSHGLAFALVAKAMNIRPFDLARDGSFQEQDEIDGLACNHIAGGRADRA